ncbi:MAG: T9SS type A sorting domain-containing protein [Vicingaceae bacterium]
MKRILSFTAILFAFSFFSSKQAQSQGLVTLVCEDFSAPPFDLTTSTRYPGDTAQFNWIDTLGFPPGTGCMMGFVGSRDPGSAGNRSETYLQTDNFFIGNLSNLDVEFKHIAYIDQFDGARLEYSFNGGNTWSSAGTAQYTGNNSRLDPPNNRFNKKSYPLDWKYIPDDTTFIWTQANADWKLEIFDFGPTIRQLLPKPDSIMFRINLFDGGGSPRGSGGTHRYFIDDFCVRASNCPTDATTYELEDPSNYPADRYEDRVYWEGPYDFTAKVDDPNGIDEVLLDYRVRRETTPGQAFTTVLDQTVQMQQVGSSIFFEYDIPKSATQIGDSVYWRIRTYDLTACRDSTADPFFGSNMEAFEVRANIPVSCPSEPLFNFPYAEDFEDNNYVKGEEVLLNDWTNVTGDFNNWVLWNDTTPTTGTGPRDDYPGGGNYLYVESTGLPDSLAFLLTPCFDLFGQQNALVRFYLHQNTAGGDTVYLDYFDTDPAPGFPNGRYVENIIPPIPGNKGDAWIPYEFSTYSIRDKVTQFRFRARPDRLSDLSDIGLDSFKIVGAALEDMRADRVVVPPYMPTGETETATIGVINQGVFDVTALTLGFEILTPEGVRIGNQYGPINWTGVLQPGEFREIEMTSIPYTVPEGQYIIRAWLTYGNDQVIQNDTTQQSTRGVPFHPIYFKDNFDGATQSFTNLSASDSLFNFWELGEPNFGRTNRAFTKPNAWDINLNRAYTGVGNTIQLLSPILDFSQAQNTFISFFNNRGINTERDGVYIQYSFDQGITWSRINETDDPNSLKWYNSNLTAIGTGGERVFAGITRYIPNHWYNWLESEFKLPSNFDNKPRVMFRFNFYAEATNSSNDGMSIDDFLVYDQKTIDMEPQFKVRPISECDMTSTESFLTVFKNRGATPVSTFDVTYRVENLLDGTVRSFTETVNRTVNPRDTIHVRTAGSLDMRELGDWKVQIITSTTGDGQPLNDTLTNIVENIDGCYLNLELNTGAYKRPPKVDSSFWRFEYTSRGREYVVTDDYRPLNPSSQNDVEVCIRKNSFVKFLLGDQDTAVINYSIYAYDGEVDTVIVDRAIGGTATPTQYFDWVCPPDSSAEAIEILLDNNEKQLPLAKEYAVDMVIINDGLDSIQTLDVGWMFDGNVQETRTKTYPPGKPLRYNRRDTIRFGSKYFPPGRHEIIGWVHDPNGNVDEKPENDTTVRAFIVVDTTNYIDRKIDTNGNEVPIDPGVTGVYCADFEDGELPEWIPFNFETYLLDESVIFERETPSTTNLNSAYTGTKSWVTDADSLYPIFNNSSLLSPFFDIQKDSCYRINFAHSYAFDDFDNDGAQLRYLSDAGTNDWVTLDLKEIGTGDTALQTRWYNTEGVAAIPNNNQNQGWTGSSGGWVRSQTMLPGYRGGKTLLAFRFGSDGNDSGEGWAIDNFCIEKVGAPISSKCFAVGLGEDEIDPDQLYLGQNQPNPAKNNTQIPFYLPKAGQVHFEVSNMMGQTVYRQKMTKSAGNHLMTVDISDFSSGIYHYWILIDGLRISKKMIVTK